MADDITLDLGIVPKLDAKGLKAFIEQIKTARKDLMRDFSSMLDSSIKPGTFTGLEYGASQASAMNRIKAIAARNAAVIEDALSDSTLAPNINKLTGGKKANLDSAIELTKVYKDVLGGVKKHYMGMASLADKYSPLLENINYTEDIYQDILAGKSTHQKNVGASRLARQRFYQLRALNDRMGGLVSDSFREATYQGVEAANQTAKLPRAAYTYNTKNEYTARATQAVFDLLYDEGNIASILESVGLGNSPSGKSVGKGINPQFKEDIQNMIRAIAKMPDIVNELNNPTTPRNERSGLMAVYKNLKKDFNKGIKVIAANSPDVRDAATGLFDKKFALKPVGLQALFSSGGPLSATVASGALGTAISTIVDAKLNADITRSALGTRKSQYEETKGLGALLLGLLGGAVGFAVGGFVGAGAGAALGGSLGAIPGSVLEKRLKANEVSLGYAAKQARNEAMYGRGYSTALTEAIGSQGLASASDVNNMTNSALTLRARMMLGMVGEQEMLLLSFMPDYFSKAMSGASEADLINSYARSGKGIGDASLRAFAMQNVMGGSQGMYAFANSPYFKSVMGLTDFAYYADAANRRYIPGMMDAMSTTVPGYNMEYVMKEMMKTSLKKDAFVYSPMYQRAGMGDFWDTEAHVDRLGTESDKNLMIERTRLLNWATTPTNINVYLDGIEIASATYNNGSKIAGAQYNVFKTGSN